ncbi:tetratricopeptide repeat protein [bacterium]|nr:tetratricopeptide repeat protein [bacterium]
MIKQTIIIFFFFLGFAMILSAQVKSVETYLTESENLRMESRFEEAKNLLLEAVAIYPFDSDIHLHLGLTWAELAQQTSQTGDMVNDMMTTMEGLNKAFAEFEEAVRLAPGNYNAHFYFGAYGVDVPVFFGKLDQGVSHLETAKSLLEIKFPDGEPEAFTAIYRYLGQGYYLQERYDEAQKAWEKVLELAPESENGDAARAGLEILSTFNVTTGNENETN